MTINASEIVNKLLESLVQEVAKAVLVGLREQIAEVTNERLGDLEIAVRNLESTAFVESDVDAAIENALESHDFEYDIERVIDDKNFVDEDTVSDMVTEAVDEALRNATFETKLVR